MRIASGTRVAFQGERGAFSEEAAVKLLGGEVSLVPLPTFDAAFGAIAQGSADYILAPVENSLAGPVQRSLDLLVESQLTIVAEVIIRVQHNLIGPPGAIFEEVRLVESHPVALAQCEQFFSSRPFLKRIATDDTAGSVREIVQARDRNRAAIGSKRAAQIYGGQILREHLEDDPENYTRFVLLALATEAAVERADKISLVFRLAHVPGALFYALEPFARREINLMKVESRPVRGLPWQYRFYLDLQASASDPEVKAALGELEKLAVDVRILGSYVSAKSEISNAS
jgi:prephenate dehydratase